MEKFPQKCAFLENLHIFFYYYYFFFLTTKVRFVGKLLQKIALLENFQMRFVGKFPQKIALLDNFHKKICNIEKLPHTKKLPPSLTPEEKQDLLLEEIIMYDVAIKVLFNK